MDDRPLSADRVPTLTEVIELDTPPPPLVLPEPQHPAEPVTLDIGPPLQVAASAQSLETAGMAESDAEPEHVPESALEPEPAPAVASPPLPQVESAAVVEVPTAAAQSPAMALPVVDTDMLVGMVLAELQPRVDMLLESRLREALAPALARVADGLIRDTQVGLSAALRDLVHESVDRALQRREDR